MKYIIHLDGETQGPFTGAELKAKDLPPDTPCAAEGDLSWGKLEEVLSAPTPHLRLEGSAMGTLVGGVLMALWLWSILTGSGLAWSHTVMVANCRSLNHIEMAVMGPDELYCVYEDNEHDAEGRRLERGMPQLYGRRIKAERL